MSGRLRPGLAGAACHARKIEDRIVRAILALQHCRHVAAGVAHIFLLALSGALKGGQGRTGRFAERGEGVQRLRLELCNGCGSPVLTAPVSPRPGVPIG